MPVTVVVVPKAPAAQPNLQPAPLSEVHAQAQLQQPVQQQAAGEAIFSEPSPQLSAVHLADEDLEEELQQAEKSLVVKKRRLKANEKTAIRSSIASVNKEALHVAIVARISGMVHMNGVEERRKFWEHCKASNYMKQACDYFLAEYNKLYKQCDKGSDKYALFYLTWYEQVHVSSSPTSAYISNLRDQLVSSYSDLVSDDLWDTFVSTFLNATFSELQTTVSQYIAAIDHNCNSKPEMNDEEDVALLRLGGWALFSCIEYRKNAVKGKSKIKHTEEKLGAYKEELQILEGMVDRKKVDLPSAITAQDRGYMTFPCPLMMPFVRNVNKKIKECINPISYEKFGSKLFKMAVQEVLSDDLLKDEWAKTVSSSLGSPSFLSAINSSGQALILKMLHSQFKEFAVNTRTLETLDEGKSADIDVALRVKLKTHASEKHLNI